MNLRVLASKKVGNSGLVVAVEPNPCDFELLKENMSRNRCRNVVPINKGVGAMPIKKEISFWGRNFTAQLDTLRNIVSEAGLGKEPNFVKMDIEGYEIQVIRKDIEILKEADVISIELHNTRPEIDNLLGSYGFSFEPLSTFYCIRKLIKNSLLSHPKLFLTTVVNALTKDPRVLFRVMLGYEIINNEATSYLQTGSYIRKKFE